MRVSDVVCAALIFVFCVGATPDGSVQVPDREIAAENARFAAFGVTLPKGGIILQNPYDPPYGNRSFIVPLSWLDNDPARIRADDLRADLPILRLLMEKTYPGWKIAADRGWDWNAWFAAWDLSLALEGKTSLTAAQAVEPWNVFRNFQLDNHSHPMVLGIEGQTLSARLAQLPNGPCSALTTISGDRFPLSKTDLGQQPHIVPAWDGRGFETAAYVAYPDHIGAVKSITCGDVSIDTSMTAQPRVQAGATYYRDLGDGIGYVRASGSFSYERNDELRKALADAQIVDKQKAIILDLRGNGGGAMPIDILSHWFTRDEMASLVPRLGTYYRLNSCYAVGLQFNLAQWYLIPGLTAPLAPETKAMVQRLVYMIGNGDPSPCEVTESRQHSVRTMLDHHFTMVNPDGAHPRVIAIVDNECGSDCEGLITRIAQLPGTVIAGTSTAGTIGFLQPGMFVLPHSRLPFMLAQSYADIYGDGRSEAGYGLSVDILLPTEQSQDLTSLKALAEVLMR
jgi:hypothetical protein